MRNLQCAAAVLVCCIIPGCTSPTQTLAASGGAEDLLASNHISTEYGSSDPDGVEHISDGGRDYAFKVWISKRSPKIMVQTASLGAVAATGFVRGLTLGLVKGSPGHTLFFDAAAKFVAANKPECQVVTSRMLTSDVFEGSLQCRGA